MARAQAIYEERLKAGALRPDAMQAAIIARLDALCQNLADARKAARSGGFFKKLFGKNPRGYSGVKSLYLYGKVGRGKTMLMDLFYSALPEGDKRRAHFNDFMSDVQNRLASYREAEKQGKVKLPREGAFLRVAADLAAEAHILCFDEFSVTDIADAMILSRLFQALFAHGAVLVATSNVAPHDLYKHGLNRSLFLPFIKLLEEKADICPLDAPTDYRLEQGDKSVFPVYLSPNDEKAKAELDNFWYRLAGGAESRAETLTVRGHDITIPRAVNIAAGSEIFHQFGRGIEEADSAREKGQEAGRGVSPDRDEYKEAGSAAGALSQMARSDAGKENKAARFDFKDICGGNLAAPARGLAGGARETKSHKAARFDFKDICGGNLAAYDYMALAGHYALFCVENIPQFSEENRNEAKRFILLIDVLYDRHMPLCVTAAAPAAQLYIGKAEITEKFEFDRAASRLTEMQSDAYLRACRL